MKKIIFTVFVLLLSVNLRAQEFTQEEKEILILQDTRSLGENNKLLGFLNSRNYDIVKKTLIALANIQDSSTVDAIGNILLNNIDAEVKKSAAFALGQIPCDKSASYLIDALKKESDKKVIFSILSALGKTGSENDLNFILNFPADDISNKVSKAFSIGRFAIRNIKNESAVNYLCSISKENISLKDEELISYSFFRMRNKKLLEPARDVLLKMTKSENENSRMWAFGALGYVADKNDIPLLINSLETDKSWSVKVNILNSLPLYKKADSTIIDEKLVDAITGCYDSGNPNLTQTALRVTALLFSDDPKTAHYFDKIIYRLTWYFPDNKAVDWQDKGDAILAFGTILKDEVKEGLLLKMAETENFDLVPYIIRSFKFFNNAMVYKELTDSVKTLVQKYNKMKNQTSGEMVQDENLEKIYLAFVETLSALKNKVDSDNQNYIRLILSEFTGSKDPALIDVCFNALNDSLYMKYRDETGKVLMLDYKELLYPKDKDAMILFINEFGELGLKDAINILKKNLQSVNFDICKASAIALKKITGKEYTFKTKPKTDFDWDFIKTLPKKRFATIKIGDEKIKFELLPEVALFSVQSFVKLAEKKFYDNTNFHRVVPNFVIQGGDPQNTGWGGPEFSIRTETSDLFYEKGIVGLGSDGKDTEGSQFFIMHSPHHHLEGRYTIIGRVIEGQNVVDRISIYDVIETITISEK